MNRKTIGRMKVVFDRWRSYIGAAQLLLIILMSVAQGTISWWHIVGGFGLSLVWMWIDMRYIITPEYEEQQKKNHDMTTRLNKIDHIEEMLERISVTDSKCHIDIRYPEGKK